MFEWLKKILAIQPKHAPDDIVAGQQIAQELADSFSFEPAKGEPSPPWLKHPEILIGSMGWRMGIGEQYLFDVFYPYWWGLSSVQQNEYFQKFDLGAAWPDREKWIASLERNKAPPSKATNQPG